MGDTALQALYPGPMLLQLRAVGADTHQADVAYIPAQRTGYQKNCYDHPDFFTLNNLDRITMFSCHAAQDTACSVLYMIYMRLNAARRLLCTP